MNKYEIVKFNNDSVEVDVTVSPLEETVWLTQEQMALLFNVNVPAINKHIRNIISENELEESSTISKMEIVRYEGNRRVKRNINIYNLDMIISVGYRVNSVEGIKFRRWANKILKDYIIKGYSVNQKRLEYLEKTVKLIDIASRIDDNLDGNEAKEILKVISNYSKALNLLDDYDHKQISKVKGNISDKRITYKECLEIINKLKYNNNSNIFALERDNGLSAIIGDIYQTFDKKDLYESIEEKASNFLYMIVKNHVFIDGNKRIGATLFIYFLKYYNILYKDGIMVIDNNTLVALTLLIAESNPKEKNIIIDLVMNFLEK